jgi:hypothetical protein
MQALRRDLTRLTIALGLTLGLLALAAQARGDDPPVAITVGGADWGVKESFRNYIEGSIAHGSIVVSEGASRNGDGSFHFPLASGTYDPTGKSTAARFSGRVHFSGHAGQLELDISDLAVEITPAGAQVFADVTSKSLADGKVVDYPNVNLAELDVSGVDPLVESGTTSWDAIPAELTEAGAPAFGGFYTPGQELDPFAFEYEGPGGKPSPETWSAPGTPGYDQLAAETGVGAAKALFVDRVRGVVHVAAGNGVRALDLETLAAKGSIASAVTLGANEYAFDAETGTVFAVQDATASNPIRAFTWDGVAGTYAETSLPINGTKTTHLAYEPSDDTLFAFEGLGSGVATADTSTLTPAVSTASRDGSGWQAVSYPALATNGRAISDVLRTGPGKFVATVHAYYVGTLSPTTIFPSEAIELTDSGSALSVKQLAGTTPPAPASGYTFGYAEPTRDPDGSVVLRENQGLAPVGHLLRLQPGTDGYAAGATVDLGASVNATVVDDTDGSVYVLKPNLSRVEVLKDDALVATITRVPTGIAELKPTYAAASDGDLYFHNNVAPTRIFAYRHVGDSPAITAEPEDASVTLTGSGGSAAVSFTAAGDADPAPQVQWQERPLGAVVWTDVPGATAPTLEVTATAAQAGNRYRAVFTNVAGAIATRVASLGVMVVPEATPTPAGPAPAAPAPPAPLAPAGVKPKLNLGGGHAVNGKGVAALARVQCPGTLICQLQAPKQARVKIGSSSYWGRVIAPKAVLAGGSTIVRLKLPPAAREALAGRSGRATLKLVVSSGEERLTRQLSIPLKGGAATAPRKMY